MLEFAHAITGGFIVSKIPNPLISLPLALLSHFAIDLLPHWNPNISKEKKKYGKITNKTITVIFIDCILALVFGFIMANKFLPDIEKWILILLGCFLGVLPDVIEAPYFLMNQKQKSTKALRDFQSGHQFNVSPFLGIIFQVFFSVLLFLLV